MRIIAGQYKGRRLKTLDGLHVRPTSDRLRETVFNILAPRLDGARFLDLCAGSGAIGIEALSRGAGEVTFIENNRRAAQLISENLQHCGIVSGVRVINRDDLSRGLLEGERSYCGERSRRERLSAVCPEGAAGHLSLHVGRAVAVRDV